LNDVHVSGMPHIIKNISAYHNFALNLILIEGLCKKLQASKMPRVSISKISNPTWESWEK
jgi:hypothetical protein